MLQNSEAICLMKYLNAKLPSGTGQGDCRLCSGVEPENRINCRGYTPVTLTFLGDTQIVQPISRKILMDML